MVKYETFNLWYMGSNPIGLKNNIYSNKGILVMW